MFFSYCKISDYFFLNNLVFDQSRPENRSLSHKLVLVCKSLNKLVCTVGLNWLHGVNEWCLFLIYRCNGGFLEGAWDYLKHDGLVTGGQYNSKQVWSTIYFLSKIQQSIIFLYVCSYVCLSRQVTEEEAAFMVFDRVTCSVHKDTKL